jgi:hypothetical protein
MLAKFSVQTDLTTQIVMDLSISGNDDGIGRSGAWWFRRRWRRVRNFLKLWEARADVEYDRENSVFLSLRPETDLCNRFGEKIEIL